MLRSELAVILEGTLHGHDAPISHLRDPNEATEHDVVCVLRDKYLPAALESRAGLLVLNGSSTVERDHIRVTNIELAWVTLLETFAASLEKPGIHPSAVIHESAILEENVQIGANAVIAKGVRVGHGSLIGAGSTIGENVRLGENCVLYERVTVRHPGGVRRAAPTAGPVGP